MDKNVTQAANATGTRSNEDKNRHAKESQVNNRPDTIAGKVVSKSQKELDEEEAAKDQKKTPLKETAKVKEAPDGSKPKESDKVKEAPQSTSKVKETPAANKEAKETKPKEE